ncbi:MAG: S49 family peptidase [Pseudomonadota bacterium]
MGLWSNSNSENQKPLDPNEDGKGREWQLIREVMLDVVTEKRRARRWSVFFKLAGLTYLIAIVAMISAQSGKDLTGQTTAHTGLITLDGEIGANASANADTVVTGLRDAFDNESAKAVVIRINSPGGSPVQSDMIYNEIRRLRALHTDKKVYAVITDMGASGAYYVASAADEIYASPASLVGSIGVISSNFGFAGLMEKLGIERRVFAAGDNKSMLDPFTPLHENQVEHLQVMLEKIHRQFETAVRQGRGNRLKDDPDLFSGLFWTGEQAKDLGLIDGFGTPGSVARDKVGSEDIVDYTPKSNSFDHWAKKLGVMASKAVTSALSSQAAEVW